MTNQINKTESVIITGSAGFIGFHLSKTLLEAKVKVIGIDNLNDYYDPKLKFDRLNILKQYSGFTFYKADITDFDAIDKIFSENECNRVIHLAAQVGVRYSINHPQEVIKSNISGFFNILESCRKYSIGHFMYASSSSVYGGNKKVPFSESDSVDNPVSIYAATKKSDELFAYTYSHLYGLPVTGLRFFTVYGPWGRPDMAYYKFTKNIYEGKPIDVYNHGKMERDFTYIDDIVEGIYRLIDKPPVGKVDWDEIRDSISSSFAPYKIYNIGNGHPVKLEHFIAILEEKTGKKAVKNYMDMQPGDVLKTYADISDLEKDIGFRPQISIEEGLARFVEWYSEYYQKGQL